MLVCLNILWVLSGRSCLIAEDHREVCVVFDGTMLDRDSLAEAIRALGFEAEAIGPCVSTSFGYEDIKCFNILTLQLCS